MIRQQLLSRWQVWWDRPITPYILLTGITLLALVLRFYKLGEWSFWIDEIATINRAQAHFDITSVTTYWQPPSLIFIGSILYFLGTNEWTARLAPALTGVITIPILYFPIRRMSNSTTALIAVLLLAVAPWHIYWSQNARFYVSLFFFYSLASFAFFFGIEEDRPSLLILSMLLLFFAFRERVFALFFVPVAVVYVLLLALLRFPLPTGYRRRNFLLFLLPGIAYSIYNVVAFVFGYYPPIVDSIRGFWGGSIDDPARILILVAFNIGISLVTLAFFGGLDLVLKKDRLALYLLLGAIIPPLLLAAANPFMFTVDRYVFMSLINWVVLGAIIIKGSLSSLAGSKISLGVVILAILLTDAASAHLMYYQINNGNRLDWRGAAQWVQEHKRDDDVVYSTRPALAAYYLDEEVHDLKDVNIKEITQSETRAWFLVDSEGLGHTNPKNAEWMLQNSQLIDVLYLRVRENIHLRIYQYNPDRQN